jgi:hypothetical protein
VETDRNGQITSVVVLAEEGRLAQILLLFLKYTRDGGSWNGLLLFWCK